MSIEINAVKRDLKGTGASRRLRRAGNVPGVVYGGGKDAQPIEIGHKELFLEFRHEAFHASVLTLILEGKKKAYYCAISKCIQFATPFNTLIFSA